MEQHTQKDEEEAKKECHFYESVLRTDTRPIPHVDRLSSIIKSILTETYTGNAWRRDFFIKQTLPRAVQTLLKRGDLDEEEAATINNFFQELLEFIYRLIPHDFVEILETLTRLFTSSRCTFYQKYGKDDSEDYPMYSTDDKQLEFTSAQGWETSYFLISNINFFGKLGGFDCIIERLKTNTPTKPNLTIVKHLIKPTFKIREILETSFLQQHVQQLLDLVPMRVLSLTDEELKNEDKKTISDISRNLEGLVRVAFPNRPCEAIDRFNLEVALKCFRSPYLEKRLAGLNDIKDFIVNVRKDDYGQKMRQGPFPMMPSVLHKNDISSIDAPILAQWLRTNNILEQLYGENMHPELVRRCVEIPRFLSSEGMLEDKQLDLIWEASEGKHESICHLIYTAIGDLSLNLPQQQIDYLYKKITSIPFSNYSVQTVNLIRTFSLHALQTAMANQLDTQYGCPILWDLIQDTTPVSHDVAHQAFLFLTEMLGWNGLAHLRTSYVSLCLNNLKQHASVVMSLRLLRSLMDMSPPKRKKTPGMSGSGGIEPQQTLEMLETNDLLTLFFEDLDFFKNSARAALAQLGPSAVNVDVKNAALVGKFPYLSQIKERLGFLDHVLTTTHFTLSIPQVTTFWNDLVIGALVPEERDEAFVWLEHTRALLQKPTQPTGEDCMFHLFLELVPSLQVDKLSKEGFAFFDFFYRYVNFKMHKITHSENNKIFIVQSWDLLGLPTLWRIVLEAKDWHVARQAIALLNRSHKNVAPALMPTAGAHLTAYLAECMQHLTVASGERRELQLQRCLALLLTILEEFETKRVGITPPGARKRHGVCTQGTPMTLNWCMYNGPKSTIVTHSNETFGTIRAKAAQRFDIPYDTVRMISAGKEYKYDSETLGERKLMDGHLIIIARSTPKVDVDAEPIPDVANLPSTILSQQQYFHQLFDLLTFNETIGKKVWDLLMLLPTNRQMLEELSELSTHPAAPYGATNGVEAGAVKWSEILDPSSTFKLLYSLQIVDSLLLPNMTYVQGETLMERAEWRERFISLGGVKHLTTILMNTDFYDHARGSKRKTCLALLLKLVKYFLTEGEQLRFSVLGGCVEPHAFAGRLLDIIWGSTGDGHPPTPVPMEDDIVKEALKPQVPEVPTSPSVPPPPSMPAPGAMQNGTVTTDMANLNFDNINLLPPPLSVEGELVRYAMALLCAAVITRQDLRDRFMTFPHMSRWLYSLSLGTTDESIRKEFTEGLYSLCVAVRNDTKQPHPHTIFLKVLLEFLGSLDPWLPTSEQYFTLLNKLVSDSCDGAAGGSTSDFTQLLHQLIKKISEHPTTETRRGIEEDKVLIGLMCLMNTLVSKDPSFKRIAGQKNIIHEIFENVLFDIPTADAHGPLCPPKAKRRTSRYVAFQLLTELATNNLHNFRELTTRLIKHHEPPEDRRTQWLYLPAGHEKAACGYVGLKNLGATCYMNSLMQQLFMIPGFRYGIFRTEDEEDNKADSLLYQMQVIFGHLQESEKKYYDMQDFCNAYKCEGQPTNTSVQMDVDEFLTMLFDKLERALKKNNILKDFFGGTIINQIISKGCEHVSEREEGFFTLSLEVKDKKHILESLDLYVVGDMLEGDNKYFCGTCSAKVDALKRCCIKTLPNTLIVHAKRFEFDLEAMKRTKLNESLEFPMRLNMEPYTKEGLARIEAEKQDGMAQQVPPIHPPEYYEYELAGILVHAGTADSGHYYSFVKEREPLNGSNSLQWIYFNDTLVEPFNTDEIPKAAFGGYDTVHQLDSVQGKYVTRTHLRVNNAYMLFYDRVKPTPKAEAGAPPVPPVPLVATPSALVPRPIFNHVWEENMKFLRDKNIFDVDYFAFLWPLVQLKPAPVTEQGEADFDHTLQCIQLGTRFIVETLSHAKEKASLGDLVTSLKPLYQGHIAGSRWFLELMLDSNMEWPRQLLLNCTTQDTREVFASLVVSVIAGLIEAGERGLYQEMEEVEEIDMEELDEEGEVIVHQDDRKRREEDRRGMYTYRKPRSLVVRFMESYIEMLPNAHQHWRYFGQYFLVLRDFALLGTPELRVLLDRHVIYQLVDFYLGDDGPHGRMHGQQQRKKMGDKFSQPVLTHMAEALSALVRGCHTRVFIHAYQNGTHANVRLPPTSLSQELTLMPNDDMPMLYLPVLYVKALKEGIHQKSITEIILHLCWEDPDFSHKIIDIIRQAINEVDHDGFKPYFDVFTPLLALQDSKQTSRVEEAMSSYLSVIEANFKFKNATLASVRYLVEIVQDNAAVRHWLLDHLDEWVDNWLISTHLESVREQTYNLVLGLIGPERDAVAVEVRQKVFQYLLSLLSFAKNHTRENRGQSDDLMGKSTAPWHLVYYARLLRLFVNTPLDRQVFAQHQNELADLLIKCDQNHYECDENKHELASLWAHVLQGSPDMVRWIVRNDRLGQSLMDYYISIRPGEKFRQYNNSSLPPFYQVLNLCCEHEAFLERVSMHRNFDWALRFLFMETADYPHVAQVLYEIIKKCSAQQKYRHRHLQNVLNYDKHNFSFDNLKRFFELMLQTQVDLQFFCERRGLEFLMKLFEREISAAVDNNTDSVSALIMLDLIVKATEWMLLPAAAPPTPTSDAPSGTPPTTPTTPTAPSTPTASITPSTPATPTTPTTPTTQQRCVEIINNWQHKGILLEYSIGLHNHPQLPYYEHILIRFNRILEVVCTLDRSFLEQLLSGTHEQLAREDDQLPATLMARSPSVEALHRRRLMQHRDQYDNNSDDAEEAHSYHSSTAYNNYLIHIINFVLNSPNIPAIPAGTTTTTPPPTPLSSLIPTVIDIAVLTTRNSYIQQCQPYAVKQHANLQLAILQYSIQRLQQQRSQTSQPADTPPLAQATSFTQALDLLRKIWDSPQHGAALRENRTLDGLVVTLLVDGAFLLDTHPTAVETVALFYTHVSRHLAPATKEKMLRAMGERTARCVNTCKRDKLAQGSWAFEHLLSLIQILTTLKLVLSVEPELKAQFVLEHQPLISTLRETVLVALVNDETINGTSPDSTPFPRLSELAQLTSFLQN